MLPTALGSAVSLQRSARRCLPSDNGGSARGAGAVWADHGGEAVMKMQTGLSEQQRRSRDIQGHTRTMGT